MKYIKKLNINFNDWNEVNNNEWYLNIIDGHIFIVKLNKMDNIINFYITLSDINNNNVFIENKLDIFLNLSKIEKDIIIDDDDYYYYLTNNLKLTNDILLFKIDRIIDNYIKNNSRIEKLYIGYRGFTIDNDIIKKIKYNII